jgi:uncharacterized protein
MKNVKQDDVRARADKSPIATKPRLKVRPGKDGRRTSRGVTDLSLPDDERRRGTTRRSRKGAPRQTQSTPTERLRLVPEKNERSIYRKAFDLAQQGAFEKGAPLLVKSHKAGDRRATYALATWYIHGRFFEVDAEKSFRMLRQAARAGIPEALFDLGQSYEVGFGVAKSLEKAAECYIESAFKSDMDAVYEVVRCVYWGIGLRRNKRLAYLIRDRWKGLTKASR